MIIPEAKKNTSSGQHWYTLTGEACHRQPDGKNTTVKHARKQNLVPSVSGILGMIEKPHLSKWKCDQMVRKCIKHPHNEGESERDYINRIHGYTKIDMHKILDFGNRVHKAIEEVNLGTFDESKDPEIWPWIETYVRWTHDRVLRVIAVEKIVVSNRWGFGGTVDLIAEVRGIRGKVIIDYKTQEYAGKKPDFRDSYLHQLAAYRKTMRPNPLCISLVINRSEPLPIAEKIWLPSQLQRGWRLFQAANALWREDRKYELTKSSENESGS
jgi:ATP-dependent exoDNAse (exonuclease V) beta subunit